MKKISFIICLSVLFLFLFSSYPINAINTGEIFEGKIVCDNISDLSDIEIKVYSSTPFFDGNGQLHYLGDTYVYSVYTNDNGEFSFNKPSTYCSYSFELESLPIGYGIMRKNQLIYPTETYSTSYLYEVYRTDTYIENGEVQVSFMSLTDVKLYTNYELISENVDLNSACVSYNDFVITVE